MGFINYPSLQIFMPGYVSYCIQTTNNVHLYAWVVGKVTSTTTLTLAKDWHSLYIFFQSHHQPNAFFHLVRCFNLSTCSNTSYIVSDPVVPLSLGLLVRAECVRYALTLVAPFFSFMPRNLELIWDLEWKIF